MVFSFLFNEMIQKPLNIFESSFMIVLLTPFLKSCQGSCYDYGNPEGAVALGAAAVSTFFGFRIKY
jgi:hypothetical protein